MTWDEYYEKFYDWSTSTQISKLSSVEHLGPSDEVTEVMLEFTYDNVNIVNRIARKAINQKIIFTGENIVDLYGEMDEELIIQLIEQSMDSFSKSDLESMDGIVDDDILVWIYKTKGLPIPEEFDDCDGFDEDLTNQNNISSKNSPGGFFSKLAMLFGIGSGISSGIQVGGGINRTKFSVGDHVKVKYRGQEGTVIDVNGDMYMVSLNDGGYVDSFYEYQLERTW